MLDLAQAYYTPDEIILLREQIKRGVEDAQAERRRRGGPCLHPRILQMRIGQDERFSGTAIVRKREKRIEIAVQETGEALYIKPDFIKLHDRSLLEKLAARFTEEQRRSIEAVVEFETESRPDKHRPIYRHRSPAA